MSGAQRRTEIRGLADQLGLAPLTAPRTHQILLTAAPAAGLTALKVGAAWRAVSGFAHGRYWPNLHVPSPARPYRETTASTPSSSSWTRTSTGRWPSTAASCCCGWENTTRRAPSPADRIRWLCQWPVSSAASARAMYAASSLPPRPMSLFNVATIE